MSRKNEKSKKRDIVKKRKQLRLARRKKQIIEKSRKFNLKKSKLQAIENLVGQLKQQEKSTFSRSAWQTSESSNNTSHGSVRSAVLNRKTPKGEFDKAAWGPSVEDITENQKSVIKSTPIKAGFNLAAWAPPDGENTEEITAVDTGKCSEGIGE